MKSRVRYREYRQSDIEAMVRLDTQCFTEPFRFDTATMLAFAEARNSIAFLATEESSPDLMGFIILHIEGTPAEPRGYIVTIDVARDSRRLGVGAALLHRAEEAASAAGASHVDLHVAIDNAGAIRFYEHQHYRRVGVEKRFYRQAGLDALVFTKSMLPPAI